MKYKVFIPQLLVCLSILFAAGCRGGGKGKVYCQTLIRREIVHDKNHEELSRKFQLLCGGHCPGKDSCVKITIAYNPPLPNGLIKKEWCGCEGDTIPQGCDVILYTYNSHGRIVQQADCTPLNSCPIATDSCIQQNRETKDTVRSVDHKDSLYIYHTQITCECMNRKGE